MTKELKQFLQNNRSLIEREQFYELYCAVNNHFKYEATTKISELSEFLIECELDPLQFLPNVPQAYLCRSNCLQHIIIPDHIEMIGRASFMSSGIRTVTFEDMSKCTSIIAYAFQSSDLESIILPTTCTDIGTSAFRDCKWLTTIVIPTKQKVYISDDAFAASENIIVYCYPGTSVEEYCINHNINYKFIEPEKRKW